ncbi:MAG: helix-turn-helix transcriptional regulator [Lentisphaerae bacterium]|nr:helix-turn-helix transcriptional regulator [Lentisphaerota bacterium]
MGNIAGTGCRKKSAKPLNIAAIARKAGMSEVSFYRHFKNTAGQSAV